MEYILFSTSLSFIITYFAIPIIIKVAKDKKLFDEPDERKVHKTVIPTLGGIGIFAGFIIAILLCVPSDKFSELKYIAAASIIIYFLGLKDDILNLSATKKLIGQFLAAGIVIIFGGVQITSMHGFLGFGQLPHLASIAFSFFTIIVITNSFNLIDGVDGLAGSLGVLTSSIFGIYFFVDSQLTYSVLAFGLTGGIIAFLIYNFSPAKIFMGDTGSLLLGLINSILVIKFISEAGNADGLSKFPLQAAPAIGVAILIIPLFDTLRVFTLRILDRRSPFSPDRSHIHHILLDLGYSHRKVTFISLGTNIAFVAVAYLLRSLDTTIVLAIILSMAFACMAILYFVLPKPTVAKNKTIAQNKTIAKPRKVFSLASESIEVD